MSDATVNYWHLRLQLFPHLISKMSKQKHLTALPEISISQLHNWLPDQEGWWHPLKWKLSPRGECQAGRGRMERGRKRHRKEEQSPSSLLSWYKISQGFCHLFCFLVDINSFTTLKSRGSMELKDDSRAKHSPMQSEFPTEHQQPWEKT